MVSQNRVQRYCKPSAEQNKFLVFYAEAQPTFAKDLAKVHKIIDNLMIADYL